jgi:hypothetical protein
MTKSRKVLPPIHPGEILREDFMVPLGLSMNKLALELHVPVTRISEIVHEPSWYYPGDGNPPGAILQYQRPVLAQRASGL